MKRLFSLLILTAAMLTAFCLSAGAEDHSLSMNYVPRTQRGTLFYLDISCDTPIGAAIFALDYDPGAAEFRGVDCGDDNASATANADGGTVTVAYSHRAGADGKLFRLAFKALKAGDTGFTLRMTQAVDGELHYLTDLPGCSLTISLGREDVEAGASMSQSVSAAKSSEASETSSGKSYGGAKSSVSELYDDDFGFESTEAAEGIFRDLSGADKPIWFMVGISTAICAGLLVAAGIFIGKRMKKSPKPESSDDDNEEYDEAPDTPENNVFKEIE